jgi:hypothetical protein
MPQDNNLQALVKPQQADRSQHYQPYKLDESLEGGDLARLVHTELHVDEFKSKLGDDADVIVLSFKVNGKEPGLDLVAFIEKGYDWILDADVSAGELDDGDYIVFIELPRDKDAVDNIMSMMSDIMKVTDQDLKDWRVRYYKSHKEMPFSREALETLIPTTPEEYNQEYGQESLDSLKAAAGVEVTTKAPKNEFTESLRSLAGIKR